MAVTPFRIVFLGPPGCGKGTQAEELVRELKLPVIGAGRLLRAIAQRDDELGQTVASYVNSGRHVPDEITVRVIKEAIASAGSPSFILDGFPRNLDQALLLGDIGLTHVFDLVVPDEVSRGRIRHRLESDPQHARADDQSEEAIAERFAVFRRSHDPLAAHYRERGILFEVDGVPSIPDVHQSIRKVLGLPLERWHEVEEAS